MTTSKRQKHKRYITAKEFDARFEAGEDIAPYLDFKKATVVKRVNVDFPVWMGNALDKEAKRLGVTRQSIIKVWISERLNPPSAKQR